MAGGMRVVLIVADDAMSRRVIADAFMRAGYGVCETHAADLVPAVPRLDAVVSDVSLGADRFRAPIVPIARPLDVAGLLEQVQLLVAEERAA
jgi:CheY-like chemotaxis protein